MREEDRIPNQGLMALAGVMKLVALPVSYSNKGQIRMTSTSPPPSPLLHL